MKEIIIDCINWFFEDGSRLEELSKGTIAVITISGLFVGLLTLIW